MVNTEKQKWMQYGKCSIGILSLFQILMILVTVVLTIQLKNEKIYNLDGFKIKDYKSRMQNAGILFLSLVLGSSLFGFLVIRKKDVRCQKPLLFLYAIAVLVIWFSSMVFGTSLMFISTSTDNYLAEICRGEGVHTNYESMLTQIVLGLDNAIRKVQDVYMCRKFYCPCDSENKDIVDIYSYNFTDNVSEPDSLEINLQGFGRTLNQNSRRWIPLHFSKDKSITRYSNFVTCYNDIMAY